MSATAWIALAALAFTGTQAWVAHRKLRLDLFDKRFKAYEDFNAAINGLRTEHGLVERPEDLVKSEHRQAVWRLQRLMRYLFPVDVAECVGRIDQCAIQYGLRHVDMLVARSASPRPDPQDFNAKYLAVLEAERHLREAQDELGRLVAPYLRQYGWVEIWRVAAKRAWTRGRPVVGRARARITTWSRKSSTED